jgi:hypothetical protein
MTLNPNWTAPLEGNDWTNEEVRRAVDWFESFVPTVEMDRRIEAAKAFLLAAREEWLRGVSAPTHDRADMAAWQMLQGTTYAKGRRFWIPEDSVQVVPHLQRLGGQLDRLREIPGAEDRAARLMTRDRKQPEGGLFELLVALAWRRRGWNVEFVPESPKGRTPDLRVFKGNRRWSVECKRMMPAAYTLREKAKGVLLAAPVHRHSERLGRPFVLEIFYKVELQDIAEDYLERQLAIHGDAYGTEWDDEIAIAQIRPPTWALLKRVMSQDDVFYGSSRMIELFAGHYDHQADHSFSGRWLPSRTHIFHATTLYHASLVSWFSGSREANLQKARHFRRNLADAESQLDTDRPGVIHVGVQTMDSLEVDASRHFQNAFEARFFQPTNSRLRWVYGNYMVPELTTDQHESWAINETMAPYKIGRHHTPWPLPGHMLLMDEAGSRPGVHWDGQ